MGGLIKLESRSRGGEKGCACADDGYSVADGIIILPYPHWRAEIPVNCSEPIVGKIFRESSANKLKLDLA